MSKINFSKANCKNCYKCLRSCPVKAIKFKNQQAQIVEERCIGCGHCLVICPQNARNVESDLEKVRNAIKSKKKVIATVAPSFAGYFIGKAGKFISALKKMGFYRVEETAAAAEIVVDLYNEYIKNVKQKNYITTSCYSVNLLIEKYYPDLINFMIPKVTPMTAHSKILKKIYGNESFIVFIGPCEAKKFEADNLYNQYTDAVVTYEEMMNCINENNINLNLLKEEKLETTNCERGRKFPKSGGILNSIYNVKGFKKLSISGIEKCMEVLDSLRNEEISNMILELSSCEGSCIGGPSRIKRDDKYFLRYNAVEKYMNNEDNFIKNRSLSYDFLKDINFDIEFKDKSIVREKPLEEEIKKIMKSMGKFTLEDELNCGVCGYDTCREKAIAIYEGMAEQTMCLHYMRNKAESISNVIFENTVTTLIILDSDMKIKEMNPRAQEIFNVDIENVKEKPISILMDDEDFKQVRDFGENIIGKKIFIPKYNVIFVENILYLRKENIIMASMVDIMEQEKSKKELIKVKENTLNVTQEVIEKQMRVAQEIASLLGETTAETKIILTKLKKVVEGEEGEIR